MRGLAEDVLDHRLNTRTVYMNPFSRFLYWNMNYHVEHHMFPMVPYHALPALHEEIKDDLPPPGAEHRGCVPGVRPTLWSQRRDPELYVASASWPPRRAAGSRAGGTRRSRRRDGRTGSRCVRPTTSTART